jgi:serine/threonine protein kinase/tetratricopeptide (TPR) repeat protein
VPPGLVGRTLGHYRVLSELGSGGMGTVYLAEDTKLGRRVALKLLPPETATRTERIERFEREARAIASLNHPGIVTLHSIEESDGIRFITMEHVEGATLGKAIPERGLPIGQLLPLAITLTDALSAAHRQGVLHRDLKPDNVMLTSEGRLKVLDFGLAKLMGVDADSGDHTTRDTQSVTQDGRILGTVAYMSPEQAQGQPVDHRSDIFALGILLYEMATGERPFKGATNLSVLSAILKDEPRPLTEVRTDLPRPLGRMIERTLAKRPEDRYQSTSDLKRDLEDLKRDLDSGELLLSTTAGRRRLELPRSQRSWRWVAWLGGVLALSTLGILFLTRKTTPKPPADGRQPVAIFFFDNLSGDPKLDWLRTGLTDMIVTDLSQSPGLRVLSTARLSQLLEESGHRDDPSLSAGVVQAVARRAEVTVALVGSFVRAGTQLRIQAQLQDPASGEVLASERVEGDAEAGLFALVDELTKRLRGRLDLPVAQAAERELSKVTTASLDAYKLYTEGMQHHVRLQEREALPFFEKAIQADPDFAMAMAKLSVVHSNLGDTEKGREYASRALGHAERLPPQERYYIEGRYYSLDPTSLDRAVKAYQAAVDHAPDELAARNNLAQLLISLRRYPEAIVHLEELRRRGHTFAGTYGSLAEAYLAEGRTEQAEAVLQDYVGRNPEQAAGHSYLAALLMMRGRYDEAEQAFARARQLDPGSQETELGRFSLAVLRGRWDEAQKSAGLLKEAPDAKVRWAGGAARLALLLYRGDLDAARRLTEEALVRFEGREQRAQIRLVRASLEADAGRPELALAEIDRLVKDEPQKPDLLVAAKARQALCLEQLGRRGQAAASRQALEQLLRRLPAALAESVALQVDGERAQLRGDVGEARALLAKAAALLPAASMGMDDRSIEIRFWLGRAAFEDGDRAQARQALQRVVEGCERVFSPIPYVRSLALLGRLEEQEGRPAEARALYERYLGFWGKGQIDRDEVTKVRRRLASLQAAGEGRKPGT